MGRIAIVGGTGPEGIGLAMRLAHGGEEVLIGSRSAERAAAAAARVLAAVPTARVCGEANDDVIAFANVIALCFPFEAIDPFLAARGAAMAGKLIIDVTNPLRVQKGVFTIAPLPEGSCAELVQRLAPEARVVGAFKNISAEHLQHLDRPLIGDVLVCGDDLAAKQEVERLVHCIPNLRPLDGGPLSSNRAVEGITALLLNLNRRYRAVTEIQIVGIKKVS